MSRLNNRCHPDMIRDFIEHGGHDPEEFPFMEEVQALRRYARGNDDLEILLPYISNYVFIYINEHPIP